MVFFTNKTPPPAIDLPAHWQGRVELKKSARARRVAIRVSAARGKIILTHPNRVSPEKAKAFALENRAWVERQIGQLKAPQKLRSGDIITVQGEKLFVTLTGRARGLVERRDNHLYVPGDETVLGGRLKRYLKAEAEKVLAPLAQEKAKTLGVKISRVRVADPKTRWGSCSGKNTLSFSWRLILAPPGVLDYVVAHEVAHLMHMNHGKTFWSCCDGLALDMKSARAWLKKHGSALHHVL